MDIIISLPDENYNHIMTEGYRAMEDGKVVYHAIRNSIILPEKYKKLIDECSGLDIHQLNNQNATT